MFGLMKISLTVLMIINLTSLGELVIINETPSETCSYWRSNECHHRDYGHGSTVCVCTEDHCDDFPPLMVTKRGIVQIFETSKKGDRFRSSQTHFEKADLADDHQPQHFIRFDPEPTAQKIIGFGGAFTDAAGVNIAKLSPKLQKRLIQDYYGHDGIEYTIGRIPIGGSDFSTRPYTYDDHVNDDDLSKFQLQPEDFQYKIPYLKMAREVSPHDPKWFASPWSPPAWMKNNSNLIHGGFLIGKPGGKYYKLFAKYFVKFLDAYQQQNVSLWGLTIENEPEAGYNPNYRWNCLGLDGPLERDFLKMDLGPELYKNGYTKDKLNIMIHDGQLPNIKEFVGPILEDKQAADYVSGIAFHWYDNSEGNKNDLDELQQKYPDKFILGTEACQLFKQNQPVNLGGWEAFDAYVQDIIEDLNHFTSGWTDWNLALDPSGGPNWVENFVDAPVIVNQTEYYKQPMFYAMGHFSKFLIPGSMRLKQQIETNTLDQIDYAVIFRRPDNGTVLIVLNDKPQTIVVRVEDPQRGLFQHALKPQSLTNFLWY